MGHMSLRRDFLLDVVTFQVQYVQSKARVINDPKMVEIYHVISKTLPHSPITTTKLLAVFIGHCISQATTLLILF